MKSFKSISFFFGAYWVFSPLTFSAQNAFAELTNVQSSIKRPNEIIQGFRRMSKHTIVVCDHIHENGLNILKAAEDINYVFAADIDKTALLDVIKDADIAITRSSTDVDEKFLNAAVNLKAIIRAGVGYDNVDMEGCSKRGIIAMNVPTANTIAAVELTMTHMLSCMRKFPYFHAGV